MSFSTFIVGHTQIVSIPDVSFKDKLINHIPLIDTNMDGEIQVSEAESFTEIIDVSGTSAVPGTITDLTGIEAFMHIDGFLCDYNEIDELDLSGNASLLEVSANHNMITTVNFTGNPILRTVSLSENNMTGIDLSSNPDLLFFQCNFSNLQALDVSSNPALQFLYVQGNALTTLDLTNHPGLFIVNLDDNQLSSLDTSGSPLLDFLFCRGNNLEQLDLSNNTNLRRLDCKSNSLLMYINLKNGNNDQFIIDGAQASNFEDLPVLETVCLDDANSAVATYITAQVGHSVTFIEDCSLGISENMVESIYAYPNPTNGILNITSQNSVARVSIYSIQGKLVQSQEVNSKYVTLDLGSLKSGIYFSISTDQFNNKGIKKIIKN